MSQNFMIDYIKIKYTDSRKLSRKYYLEPLAFIFDIKTYKYSNRKLLIHAIISAIPKSQKYYNSTDPISLESLDTIDSKYLYEWKMNNKIYAMHIKNLYTLVEKKQTVLPWALDEASGIYKSQHPEEYTYKYDMKYQNGLIEDITQFYKNLKNDIEPDNEDDEISIFVRERFKFENIIDGLKNNVCGQNSSGQELYVSHLVDTFLNLSSERSFNIIIYAINHCKTYFNNLYIDYILSEIISKLVYKTKFFYTDTNIIPNIVSLIMLNETLMLMHDIINTNYNSGVIRYVLLLLNEIFI